MKIKQKKILKQQAIYKDEPMPAEFKNLKKIDLTDDRISMSCYLTDDWEEHDGWKG